MTLNEINAFIDGDRSPEVTAAVIEFLKVERSRRKTVSRTVKGAPKKYTGDHAERARAASAAWYAKHKQQRDAAEKNK